MTEEVALQTLDIKLVLGGFGLFIIGMTLLGDSLKEAAGPKIKIYIEKYTSNIFMAILVGTVITGLIQSSSAATVISISLVRAGLMSLNQAIGISIGANIGTTVTSIMIGLKIDGFGYYFVFLGALFYVFSNKTQVKNIAYVLFSFGITFVGLTLMGEQLNLLQYYPEFMNFVNFISQYQWLAFLGGTLATALINSSSAFIAIVQKLFASGSIGLPVVIALVLGSNVGTTITAFLAAMGGSVAAKRAALFHTIFNFTGAVVVMFVIGPYTQMVQFLALKFGAGSEFTVAIAHFLFNLIFSILVIPLIPSIMKLLERLIKGDEGTVDSKMSTVLDEGLIIEFPDAAMQLAKQGTLEMGELVVTSIKLTHNYFNQAKVEDYMSVIDLENVINQMDTNLTNYLLKIARTFHNPANHIDDYTKNLEIVKNFERIGDLNLNLVNFFHLMNENQETFSDLAIQELEKMIEVLLQIIEETLVIFESQNTKTMEQVLILEDKLDHLEEIFRVNHFERLKEGICFTPVASAIYVDILSTLERMGDHAVNAGRFVDSVTKIHNTKTLELQ